MANLKISDLIQRTPDGTEFLEVIIPPFTPGTNRKVLLQDILDMAGTVDSVVGTSDRVTSSGGANPAIDISATFEALLQKLANAAVAITDASTMDITAIKNTLTTSSATRTFTISYTGDDITVIVTLNATASVFAFPATALCVSEGAPSGDNTCSLAGISGDKYVIAIKKVGSNYYVVCKNFSQ